MAAMALHSAVDKLCEDPNASMLAAGRTGLKRCVSLQAEILGCQAKGKKVIISAGGGRGTLTFAAVAEPERVPVYCKINLCLAMG